MPFGSSSYKSLQWSTRGELETVSLPPSQGGAVVTYSDDPDHLLIERQRGTDTRRFAWDGPILVEEQDGNGDPLLEHNTAARGFGTLAWVYDHTADDGRLPVFDGSGNVSRVRNGDSELLERQLMTAFGELKHVDGGDGEPSLSFLGEHGGWRDPATGLIYLRQRWYDPITKQFLSPDPLGRAADTNPYRYSGNDPVNAMDPDGLDYIDNTAGSVFWQVEHDGWTHNANVTRHSLGTVGPAGWIHFNDTWQVAKLKYSTV